MPLRRPGNVSVQAHRYNLRRLENALSEGESVRKGLGGPRPGTWTAVGGVAAGLLLAGSAVYGVIKPAPSIGDAHVVVDSSSGTPYVISHGTIYPAMNLASALLAGATSNGGSQAGVQPKSVDGAAIDKFPRGQLVGIAGAPNTVADKNHLLPSQWAACDDAASAKGAAPDTKPALGRSAYVGTTVTPQGATSLDPSRGVLVTPDGKKIYLVSNGSRVQLSDGNDTHGLAALGKSAHDARTVSTSLLNAIPERGSVTEKPIAESGKAMTVGAEAVHVGDVVKTSGGSSNRFYAVLSNGLESISPVQADLMRSLSHQAPNVPTISPADVAHTPTASTDIGLSGLPTTWPTILPADHDPVMCLNWSSSTSQSVSLGTGLPTVKGGSLMSIPPQKGKTNPNVVDKVFVPAGHGLAVGASSDGSTTDGPTFYISDQGVAYPLADDQAVAALGLQGKIKPGSDDLVQMLPQGPLLDTTTARKVYPGNPS